MATVAVVKTHFVQAFHCREETWAPRVQLAQHIQADDTSVGAVLPDGSVFVSGGNAVSDSWPCAFKLAGDGAVARLSNLLSPRGHHGVICFQGAVFVFGGRYYGELLNDAEKLTLDPEGDLPQRPWKRLPYMPTERAFFQPCASPTLIFLCGGGANNVESFDPVTERYEELPFRLPEVTRNHLAAWEGDGLVVVSQGSITRWRGGVETNKHETWPDVWGNFAAVQVGSCLYTVKGDTVLKIDLVTCQQAKLRS